MIEQHELRRVGGPVRTSSVACRTEALFEEVYDRYLSDVRALCARLVGDCGRAEDLAQEVFVRVLQHIGSFDTSRPFWPWLSTITRRVCIDFLRSSNGRVVSLDSSDDDCMQIRISDLADSTWEEVLRRQDVEVTRRVMSNALDALNPRDRRILWLRDVERWRYEEIADVDGSTVHSIRNLAWRARNRIRVIVSESALNAPALLPLFLLRALARSRTMRQIASGLKFRRHLSIPIRNALGFGERIPAVVPSLTAVLISIVAVLSPTPRANDTSTASRANGTTAVDAVDMKTTARATRETRVVADPPLDRPYADRGDEIHRRVVNQTDDASPENSSFLSFVSAPNYGKTGAGGEKNRNLVALGDCTRIGIRCRVLFTSDDGGATWVKRISHSLSGDSLLLSPTYPEDPRIFVMGPTGLQVSADMGDSFHAATSITGSVSISPNFDVDDPRIFVGGEAIFEYDASTGQTRLAEQLPLRVRSGYGVTRGRSVSVHLSPAYAVDGTYLVVSTKHLSGVAEIFRCVGQTCTTPLSQWQISTPQIAFSPRFSNDHALYVRAPEGIFRSVDAGHTFTRVRDHVSQPSSTVRPGALSVGINARRSTRTLFAPAEDRDVVGDTIVWSDDEGGTWHILPSTPRFYYAVGIRWVAGTSTGQIFAFAERGLACSVDHGRSWHPRCQPA